MKHSLTSATAVFALINLLSAPATGAPIMAESQAGAKTSASLYDRIGGEKALRVVVDDFVAAAAPDPKVDFTRGGKWQASDAAVHTLKVHLVDMLGAAFGGPQKYSGRSMKATHQGMGITAAQFEALAGHLKTTLEKHKVGKAETAEIMAIAASTANDIIEVR